MIWLVTFIVMLVVVAGMAIGVMAGRKPIAGSCGGIANLGIEKECGICGNDFSKCTGNKDREGTTGDSGPIAQSTEVSRPR